MKGENLKEYLVKFNSVMVQFSNSLELRRPSSMEEIRTQAEKKHINAEKDLANHLETKCQLLAPQVKPNHKVLVRAHPHEGGYKLQSRPHDELVQFIPLKTKRT
ncbi:hypothetical protein CR513_33410, partial [Mucuna pruriens]